MHGVREHKRGWNWLAAACLAGRRNTPFLNHRAMQMHVAAPQYGIRPGPGPWPTRYRYSRGPACNAGMSCRILNPTIPHPLFSGLLHFAYWLLLLASYIVVGRGKDRARTARSRSKGPLFLMSCNRASVYSLMYLKNIAKAYQLSLSWVRVLLTSTVLTHINRTQSQSLMMQFPTPSLVAPCHGLFVPRQDEFNDMIPG
jgi:hypothetical protein